MSDSLCGCCVFADYQKEDYDHEGQNKHKSIVVVNRHMQFLCHMLFRAKILLANHDNLKIPQSSTCPPRNS